MHIFRKCTGLLTLLSSVIVPFTAQANQDVQGFWASGYGNGNGGQLQLQLTIIDGIGELKLDSQNWGDLGFAICEYLFPVEGGQAGPVLRNTGAGTGNCPDALGIQMSRPSSDLLAVTFDSPAIGTDAFEFGGILTPLDPAARHAPIPGFDVLGAAPGMTEAEIDAIVTEKGFARAADRDQIDQFDGYAIDRRAWGRSPDENGKPTDWIFATFTARKDWLPDEVPVASSVGRDWNIPTSEAISGATLVNSLAQKYGPRSNSINEDRLYDRAGNALADAFSCPDGFHQQVRTSYQMSDTLGEEDVQVTCGGILDGYIGTDSSSGRAIRLMLRLTDPDPLRDDFWKTWSHSEGARLKTVYEGVSGATGAAPEL